MASNDRVTNPQAGYFSRVDTSKACIGVIKDNSDGEFMGRVRVWIRGSTAPEEDPRGWIWVNYCSPFAGATPRSELGGVYSSYNDTQKSYGFWAVPPDIDNEVIVMFIDGDIRQGYWIGCLFQKNMNQMVPGISEGAAYQATDAEFANVTNPGIPVAEYNKQSLNSNLNPFYQPLAESLLQQGLLTDPLRGAGTSSARRESPSKVFGMLTPQGNQFIMDDGEQSSLIRIRTQSGTQVLVSETFGHVYIISGSGNSWVEVNNEGYVDIYGAKDISMRTEGNFNIRADKDINIEAGGGINMKSLGTSGYKLHCTVGDINETAINKFTNLSKDYNLHSDNAFIKNNKDYNLHSNNAFIKQDADYNLHSNNAFIKQDADFNLEANNIFIKTTADYNLHVNNAYIQSDASYNITADSYFLTVNGDLNFGGNGHFAVKGNLISFFSEAEILFNGTEISSQNGGEIIPADATTGTDPTDPTDATDAIDAIVPTTQQKLDLITTIADDGSVTETDSNLVTIVPRVPHHEPWPDHAEALLGTRELVEEGDSDATVGSVSDKPENPLPVTGSPRTGMEPGVYLPKGYVNGQPNYSFSGSTGDLKPLNELTIDDQGIAFIARYEAFSSNIYLDAAGKPTIGYGHLITASDNFTGAISQDAALALLASDCKIAETGIRKNCTAQLSQPQFNALVSFVFNVGGGAFAGSTLLKQLNAGNYAEVPNQLTRWNKAGGKVLAGLVRRRRDEGLLFSTPATPS